MLVSTKIYEAYRFQREINMQELVKIYRDWRAELQDFGKRHIIRLATTEAMFIMDCYCCGEEEKLRGVIGTPELEHFKLDYSLRSNIWSIAERKTRAAIKAKSRVEDNYDMDYDMGCSYAILACSDKTLLMPFTNNRHIGAKFTELLRNHSELMEYGYWNNVDKPEYISDEDWAKRKIDWDEALHGIGIPSQNGAVFYIIDENFYIDDIAIEDDFINNHITSKVKERAERVARMLIREDKVDELWGDKNDMKRRDVSGILLACGKWLQEEEALQLIQQKTNEIMGKIISDPIEINKPLGTKHTQEG